MQCWGTTWCRNHCETNTINRRSSDKMTGNHSYSEKKLISLYIYIYIYVCMCVCVCMYVCVCVCVRVCVWFVSGEEERRGRKGLRWEGSEEKKYVRLKDTFSATCTIYGAYVRLNCYSDATAFSSILHISEIKRAYVGSPLSGELQFRKKTGLFWEEKKSD